jgi:hypothetical protein
MFDKDSAEYGEYWDIESQFSVVVGRARRLPKELCVLALLSWHAELGQALQEMGVEATPKEETHKVT